jgi:hypothetical protein
MKSHLAVAEAFVQELHETQQNIVAILLAGSVACRQTAPFSDIDLSIIVTENEDHQVGRSASTWREGIYIDAGFRPQSAFTQLEQVLSSPSAATAIAYGMILYDPTGFLAALQAEVQTHYMQPRWLHARMQSVISRIQSRLDRLSAAVAVQDSLQICIHAGPIVFGIALLPLIRHGIAPSSTRHLVQLAESAPELAESVSALEGSLDMTGADVEATYNVFAQLTTLGDTSRWGQLPIYMMRKVEWMIHHDLEKAAVHTMWNNVGFRINDCLATPGVADETQRLAQAWLHQTGWVGGPTLAAKLQMASRLFDQVNTMPD